MGQRPDRRRAARARHPPVRSKCPADHRYCKTSGEVPVTVAALRTVQVDVLGPLSVRVAGRPVAVGPGRLRALLAVLAMSPRHFIGPDRLATAIWGQDLPGDARRSVQTYVARLRRLLGSGAIRSGRDGYLLEADVDAVRYLRVLDVAASEQDPDTERERLRAASALWRGTPFDGVRAAWLDQVERPRLIDRRLRAEERRIDLELAAGAGEQLIGELRELTAVHPLRERLWAQLMTALHRADRRSEALDAYQAVYRLLDDELGVTPGTGLRELHQQILRGDNGRAAWVAALLPRQLPPRTTGFVGRAVELARLDSLLARTAGGSAVITGGPGAGTTSVAVQWAHRVADRFPDGQLYANLRGFARPGRPAPPDEVVRGFLETLGVPADRHPTAPAARIGLYRSLLAGRRLLVLLDDAADAEQVRPLLPGGEGCVALVTSRVRITGLTAQGALPVPIDALSAAESRELLEHRLGVDRVRAEPVAVDRLVGLCAGLPLALAVVAARAALHPLLGSLAADVCGSRAPLDALSGTDPATDLRESFSRSYGALGPAARRLFRALGVACATGATATEAALLAAVPLSGTGPGLAELSRHHLVVERSPGRYAVPGLLRAYAAELPFGNDRAS
ncbi:AfsR/SARP family transcriptional regulator [Pseudonocardia humida]|uniref:AfsR/SARP family transcriptional regulator n=1 Tax=Pseudonocardia humida TaxID=2800819 RepID=A0ABT1ADJ6_9PSEU|nr:AfsR/SARP family transcriptional regulator [Pseudonocardia humida]MCO1660980.1 AfsR/SARP family transcriptional regulator [Pseudonocardia humida]